MKTALLTVSVALIAALAVAAVFLFMLPSAIDQSGKDSVLAGSAPEPPAAQATPPPPTATPTPVPPTPTPTPEGEVTICHIPPDNPDNPRTITISRSALPAHLARGDTIGPCSND
jgi:hypothetical protein